MVTAWVPGRALVTPPPPQTGSGEGRDGHGRRGEIEELITETGSSRSTRGSLTPESPCYLGASASQGCLPPEDMSHLIFQLRPHSVSIFPAPVLPAVSLFKPSLFLTHSSHSLFLQRQFVPLSSPHTTPWSAYRFLNLHPYEAALNSIPDLRASKGLSASPRISEWNESMHDCVGDAGGYQSLQPWHQPLPPLSSCSYLCLLPHVDQSFSVQGKEPCDWRRIPDCIAVTAVKTVPEYRLYRAQTTWRSSSAPDLPAASVNFLLERRHG